LLIVIAKEAHDDEEFIAKVEKHNINISKNFLDSLYGTIMQKLPQRQHAVPEVLLNEPKVEAKETDEGKKGNYFSGLNIPNQDEIDLELGD
jgi:hypothetical protein